MLFILYLFLHKNGEAIFSDTAHGGLLTQKTFSKATFYKSLYVLSVIRLIKNTTKFKKQNTTHTHNIPWKRKQKPFGNASFLNTYVYLKKNLNCKINRNSRNQFSYFKSVHDFIISRNVCCFFQPKITSFGENILNRNNYWVTLNYLFFIPWSTCLHVRLRYIRTEHCNWETKATTCNSNQSKSHFSWLHTIHQ